MSVNVTSHIVQYIVGDNIVLTCSTSGLPVYAIHWMKEGSFLYPSCKLSISSGSPNSSVLNIYNIVPSDAGVYQCIAYSYYSHSVVALSAQLSMFKSIFCIKYYLIYKVRDLSYVFIFRCF